jgi:hypothetical protein
MQIDLYYLRKNRTYNSVLLSTHHSFLLGFSPRLSKNVRLFHRLTDVLTLSFKTAQHSHFSDGYTRTSFLTSLITLPQRIIFLCEVSYVFLKTEQLKGRAMETIITTRVLEHALQRLIRG